MKSNVVATIITVALAVSSVVSAGYNKNCNDAKINLSFSTKYTNTAKIAVASNLQFYKSSANRRINKAKRLMDTADAKGSPCKAELIKEIDEQYLLLNPPVKDIFADYK